jgi:pimeloyl-ACP methyl ester carboxylesterase
MTLDSTDNALWKLSLPETASSLPLVLLHGWGQSAAALQPLAELFAPICPVYLVNFPGFGGVPAPETAWGTQEYAVWLRALLEKHGLKRAIFLGHSFGGRICLRLAADNADGLVAGLLLCNSHGIRSQRTPMQELRFRAIGLLRSAVKFVDSCAKTSFYNSWFIPRFASADYKAAGALRQSFVKVVLEDQESSLGNIAVPCSLLWGARDTETPPELGRRIASGIKGSEYIELPGKGHNFLLGAGAHLCAYYLQAPLKRMLQGGQS